jgi:hypothetical protein
MSTSLIGDLRDKVEWAIYGMALPDKILEKVYHKNAEKIFAMYRGEK